MSEKDLGEELEKFEEGIENLKNTEFKLFGIRVTPLTIGAAFSLVSAVIGGLYGAFTVYNDYMDMKEQIQSYVAPDLSGFEQQLSVMEEQMRGVEDSVVQATDYSREIRNTLKSDIMRLEGIVDDTTRRVKDTQDTIDTTVRELEKMNRDMEKDVRTTMRDTETRIDDSMRQLRTDLEDKLQKALDNPLAN